MSRLPAIHHLGWALLDSLWQGALVAIVLAGILFLLHKADRRRGSGFLRGDALPARPADHHLHTDGRRTDRCRGPHIRHFIRRQRNRAPNGAANMTVEFSESEPSAPHPGHDSIQPGWAADVCHRTAPPIAATGSSPEGLAPLAGAGLGGRRSRYVDLEHRRLDCHPAAQGAGGRAGRRARSRRYGSSV